MILRNGGRVSTNGVPLENAGLDGDMTVSC
jgi:hypothetical protein